MVRPSDGKTSGPGNGAPQGPGRPDGVEGGWDHGGPKAKSASATTERELVPTEADLVSAEWSVLAEYYTTPGGSDEAIRVYLARGLTPTADAFARTDEEADIETRWVDLDEVVTAVLERRIQNPSTVIAVLQAHVARSRGWSTLGPADAPWPRHPKLRRDGTAPAS